MGRRGKGRMGAKTQGPGRRFRRLHGLGAALEATGGFLLPQPCGRVPDSNGIRTGGPVVPGFRLSPLSARNGPGQQMHRGLSALYPVHPRRVFRTVFEEKPIRRLRRLRGLGQAIEATGGSQLPQPCVVVQKNHDLRTGRRIDRPGDLSSPTQRGLWGVRGRSET